MERRIDISPSLHSPADVMSDVTRIAINFWLSWFFRELSLISFKWGRIIAVTFQGIIISVAVEDYFFCCPWNAFKLNHREPTIGGNNFRLARCWAHSLALYFFSVAASSRRQTHTCQFSAVRLVTFDFIIITGHCRQGERTTERNGRTGRPFITLGDGPKLT